MKCIQCGTENNLRDRTANFGRCSQCRHLFTFDPQSFKFSAADKVGRTKIHFTDPFFAKAIADLSANDSLFFTEKQFFYLLDKRLSDKLVLPSSTTLGCFLIFLLIPISAFVAGFLKKSEYLLEVWIIGFAISLILMIFGELTTSNSPKIKPSKRKSAAKGVVILGIAILCGGISLSITLLKSYIIFLIAVLVGMASIFLGSRQFIRLQNSPEIISSFLINRADFQNWLSSWTTNNLAISKLLPSPRQESLPAQLNPDVTAYSFDRVVVCDRAEIAQFLIANNFHFENNCAILSITGYPQSVFGTVMEMLRRNPDLKVYALHDCSPRGLSLVNHLKTNSNWFADSNVQIFDLGLTPQQVFGSKTLFIQSSPESAKSAQAMPTEIRSNIPALELAWLDAGRFVELESFTPQRLLQVVTQGIAKSRDPNGDSLTTLDDGGTGVYLFAVDSFG